MARTKGSPDRKKRKARLVAKATDIVAESRRRFRKRFGMDFTEEHRAEVLETVDAKPSDPEWRGGLAFVAARRRLSFAIEVLADLDLAMLSFLCGAKVPTKHREWTASEVLDFERGTFAKQRSTQADLDASTLAFIAGMKSLNTPEVQRVLGWMAEHGLLTAKGPRDLAGQARDRQTALVAHLWANSSFVRSGTE